MKRGPIRSDNPDSLINLLCDFDFPHSHRERSLRLGSRRKRLKHLSISFGRRNSSSSLTASGVAPAVIPSLLLVTSLHACQFGRLATWRSGASPIARLSLNMPASAIKAMPRLLVCA